MIPRDTGYGLMSTTAPGRFHGVSLQTERPLTPLNPLVQQSTIDNYREVLDRLGGPSPPVNNNPSSELTHILLPKDVNYYYLATDKVNGKVQSVFQAERQAIENIIDEYLKEIVNIFELKKAEIFAVLKKNEVDFDDFYKKFRNQVQNFLDVSMNKLDRSMMMEKDLQQSISEKSMGDLDPLEDQLKKINIDRMKVEARQRAIDEIYQDYKRSTINEHKRVIESMIVEGSPNEPDRQRTSVNKGILAQSLDGVIASLRREMGFVKFVSEPVRPSSKMDQLRQSGTLRVTSPMLVDKLNPLRTPMTNGDTSASKIGGLSKFGPMPSLGLGSRPSSCEPFKGSIVPISALNLEQNRATSRPPSELQSINEERSPFGLGSTLSGSSGPAFIDPRIPKPMNGAAKPKDPKDYINIYNTAKALPRDQPLPNSDQKDLKNNMVYQPSKIASPPSILPSSIDTRLRNLNIRPTSGNTQRFNALMPGRVRQDIEPIRLINPPLISDSRTHLMSKTNNLPVKFNTKLLMNDHNSRINCFELDTTNFLLILGTVDEKLIISDVDMKSLALINSREVDVSFRSYGSASKNGGGPEPAKSSLGSDPNLPSGVITIVQQKPGIVLVSSNSTTNSNVCLVDAVKGTVLTQYKAFHNIIRLLSIIDHDHFLAIVEEDKIQLYRFDSPNPKRIFRIPTSRIVDVCVTSSLSILTGSDKGEIRIIKYKDSTQNPADPNILAIEGLMSINQPIKALDTFHNNKKLLLVYAQSGELDQVHILNFVEKRALMVIDHPKPLRELFGYAMLTLHRAQQGQAYLLAFGDNQVKHWDIDKKDGSKLLESVKEESFHMKVQPFGRVKPVKMIGLNSQGQIVAMGLCTTGIMSFTLV